MNFNFFNKGPVKKLRDEQLGAVNGVLGAGKAEEISLRDEAEKKVVGLHEEAQDGAQSLLDKLNNGF